MAMPPGIPQRATDGADCRRFTSYQRASETGRTEPDDDRIRTTRNRRSPGDACIPEVTSTLQPEHDASCARSTEVPSGRLRGQHMLFPTFEPPRTPATALLSGISYSSFSVSRVGIQIPGDCWSLGDEHQPCLQLLQPSLILAQIQQPLTRYCCLPRFFRNAKYQ